MNSPELQENLSKVESFFQSCKSPKEIYAKIMQIGQEMNSLEPSFRTEKNLVRGCQSEMFLLTEEKNGKLYFKAYSDALISAGLAALLIYLLEGLSPSEVLQYEPKIFDTLQIASSLSPSRSNGLYHIHLRMKQDALKHLLASQSNHS